MLHRRLTGEPIRANVTIRVHLGQVQYLHPHGTWAEGSDQGPQAHEGWEVQAKHHHPINQIQCLFLRNGI